MFATSSQPKERVAALQYALARHAAPQSETDKPRLAGTVQQRSKRSTTRGRPDAIAGRIYGPNNETVAARQPTAATLSHTGSQQGRLGLRLVQSQDAKDIGMTEKLKTTLDIGVAVIPILSPSNNKETLPRSLEREEVVSQPQTPGTIRPWTCPDVWRSRLTNVPVSYTHLTLPTILRV